ncbi:MAG: hypothetical protein LC674_04495 [Actinobacteria bacterium]|nr:hypothetical protein [Actinomycetota bacterium]
MSNEGRHVYFVTGERLVRQDRDSSKTDIYENARGHIRLVTRSLSGETVSKDMLFRRATADGMHVFFVTAERVSRSDRDGGRISVYERAGHRVRLVSGEVNRLHKGQAAEFVGRSFDASHLFLAAVRPYRRSDFEGVAHPPPCDTTDRISDCRYFTLYQVVGDATTLIAKDARFLAATPDGASVFFETWRSLIPQDADSSYPDIYEHRNGVNMLVSAPQAGDGEFAPQFEKFANGHMFFTTEEALSPQDIDGEQQDVYERVNGATVLASDVLGRNGTAVDAKFVGAQWDGARFLFELGDSIYAREGGSVSLVLVEPNGVSLVDGGISNRRAQGVSRDLSHLYFTTRRSLLKRDRDKRGDLYSFSKTGWQILTDGHLADSNRYQDEPWFNYASSDGSHVFFSTWARLVGSDSNGDYDLYENYHGHTHLIAQSG